MNETIAIWAANTICIVGLTVMSIGSVIVLGGLFLLSVRIWFEVCDWIPVLRRVFAEAIKIAVRDIQRKQKLSDSDL